MKILIVEKNQDLLRSLLKYFDLYGYNCDVAKNINQIIKIFNESLYDCVIINTDLIQDKEIEIIPLIKKKDPLTGVVVTSTNDELNLKLKCFDSGADDFLVIPFHLEELNARLKAILRRQKYDGNNKIIFNEIEINTNSNDAKVNGQLLKLTKKEYELFLFLVTNRHKIVTKQAIADYLWSDYSNNSDYYELIYTHLKNLRKKINDAGGVDYIKTVYGIGYKIINS
jgi:DNA-binding response OmpR family regulator